MVSALTLNRFKRASLDASLTFESGLYGFEDHRQFSLTGRKKESPFLRLTHSKLQFIVIDPYEVCPGYQPHMVKTTFAEPAFLLAIVCLQQEGYTINLAAPLLIEWEQRRGQQLLIPDEPTEFLIKDFPSCS